MNEFIDKLLARLEEYLQSEKNFKEIVDTGKEIKNPVVSRTIGRIEAYESIKEIANQLAEEYKSNVMIDGQYCWQTCGATEHCKECNRLCNGSIDYYENYDFMAEEHKGGWIPFMDPTCDSGNIPNGEVLVCKKDGTIDFDIYDFMRDDWKFNSKHHKNKVIAWQPLPEPYKAEEPQPKWKQAMMNTFLKR